jgi:endonuclease/exonuclease/phosphatase family metal-dependent hydrolase
MPRLLTASALIAILLVSSGALYGCARTHADTHQGGRRLRVATYNIHFGSDERERYNMQRTVDTLAALDADLIGVQELLRNHAQYRCDDQPAQLAEGLRRATGKRWRYVYINEWVTEQRDCLEAGRGDDVETEGLGFFTSEPPLDVDYVRLWHTRIGVRARIPSAPEVSVIVTHLANAARNLGDRIKQIETLVPWSVQQGPTRILMGDFNASPMAAELSPITAIYRDAWAEAAARGTARGVRSGSTRADGQSRIDYVMYTPTVGLQLEAVDVVDTSGLLHPWEASDHRPVVATFRLADPPLEGSGGPFGPPIRQ